MNLVHLLGYTGLGDRQIQHEADTAPTLGNRFREILSAITRTKKWIVLDTRHRVLGDLSSMEISFPKYLGLLSHM